MPGVYFRCLRRLRATMLIILMVVIIEEGIYRSSASFMASVEEMPPAALEPGMISRVSRYDAAIFEPKRLR